MRLHPTDTDRQRLIWPATANAEFRVVVSVWVGTKTPLPVGLPLQKCRGQDSNLH